MGASAYRIKPQDFDLDLSDRDELIVETAEESLEMIEIALTADDHPASDIVAERRRGHLCGCAHSLEDGVEAAWEVMESGEAMKNSSTCASFSRAKGQLIDGCSTTILDRIVATPGGCFSNATSAKNCMKC